MAKNKMKVRLKNSAKSKRWKKGSSCLSNPEKSTFRSAAKNNFFQPDTGSGFLTEESIKKHNEITEDMTDPVDVPQPSPSLKDGESVDARTFATWATTWSECTNTTFSRVQRYFNSNSALHREVLAVLAAVTEVIKTEGGMESDTEYFAILMTALETADTVESMAAITYLLNLVIKRTPAAVLRSKFSDVSKRLMNILGEHTDTGSPTLLKSCLLSIAGLLRVQPASVWAPASTHQIYSSLLTFITHQKPKVRKTAQQCVKIVIKTSTLMTDVTPAPTQHPATPTTAKYCIETIDKYMGSHNYTPALHVITLLADLLSQFPYSSLKSSCEVILKVMTFNNPYVTSCGMKALHTLFLSCPAPSRMTSDLNAKLISALYDYQPSAVDVQPTKAWLAVMEAAHTNLARLEPRLCLSHLPRVVASCGESLLTERHQIREHAARTLTTLISECLTACTNDLTADNIVCSNPVLSIHKTMEATLGYQYHSAWGLILGVFSVYFKSMGKALPNMMVKCLEQMASLRETPGFSHKSELDRAVGSAVRVMGVRAVLGALPLNITGDDDDINFPRSWLLLVIRDNVERAELSFFTSYLLPLAVKLKKKAIELGTENQIVLSKSYDALQLQIWSMLPGFCTDPTDAPAAFPALAKVIGLAITDRADLRLGVMAALRKLVTFSLDKDAERAVVTRFTKNYLPILFNGFTSEPEGAGKVKDMARLAYLQTAKVLFQVTPPELMATYCDKCLVQVADDNISHFKRVALVDITTSMVPYVDSGRLQQLFDYAVDNLQSNDRTIQKKSYRILEELCACRKDPARQLVETNLSRLRKLLVNSLSSSQPSSKSARLRCLSHLFKQLPAGHKKLVDAAIPEAILCTKEIGERTHKAAYDLIIVITAYVQRTSDKTPSEALDDVMYTVIAGLAGTPHMIAATTATLTRLLYQFRGDISQDVRTTMIETMCVLLACKTREVLKEILVFLKIFIFVHEDVVISPHLKQIVDSLMSMTDDTRHHFRFVIKKLFTKLIKKFSFEIIKSMTPESYLRVLNNIRKAIMRKQKSQDTQHAGEESDDEDVRGESTTNKPETIEDILGDSDSDFDDADDAKKEVVARRKSTDRAWLKEDDGDIIDFLDPSAARKITGTEPVEEKKRKKHQDSDFKLSSDGRMIITQNDDNTKDEVIDDEQDLDDLMETIEMGTKAKSRKRKLMYKEADSDVGSTASSKYKGGGSGIHRPVGISSKKRPRKTYGETSGAEFRAKRAGGDIKRGAQDPYAYIPLKFSNLNKRKQAKIKGQFKNLVHGAKRGVVKGSKKKQKRK